MSFCDSSATLGRGPKFCTIELGRITVFSRTTILARSITMAVICLWLTGWGGPSLGPLAGGAQAAERPNVVVILTDDQGWGDLSCNGNTNLSTPRLDSLAKLGARFDRFYVCPVCAPSSSLAAITLGVACEA